jgi:alpha-L-fucosidase
MKQSVLALSLGAMLFCSCGSTKEEYYTKHLVFPEGATLEQKIDMASRLVPSPQQLAWQQLELTAFLHFGINTFTNREWGDGSEDPALFNPVDLDAEQWVRSLKDAGFKLVILTAKHHDGFCLWPTATTDHSVASSPWRDGKGDVVKELREACDKYDMKFGVYLSPWDRHAPCYGDSPAYNQYFVDQLTELLTNYGEVHEVWFDGACAEGPNGRKQEYDWDRFYNTIKELQPKAVMSIMGDDVRWVGNERGLGRPTEWSATALVPSVYARSEEVNGELGLVAKSPDLGSRELVARAKELFWYPSEVDVSIRPGWFYHASEDERVKSLEHLVNIYFESVGYNSSLLLNIPPDTRGLIHDNDVARLKELATYLDKTFADNFIHDSQPWSGAEGTSRTYGLAPSTLLNTVMLQEDIARGQRIESFSVEVKKDNEWVNVGEGTTVGYKRLLRFPQTVADSVRVTILGARGTANVSAVGAFYAAPIMSAQSELALGNIDTKAWRAVGAEAAAAFDGDVSTTWSQPSLEPLVIDLGRTEQLKGFVYVPTEAVDKSGTPFKYAFSVSRDGKEWTPVACSGEFANIMHNPIPQYVTFAEPAPARFVKFESLEEIGGKQLLTVGEFGLVK